MDLRSIVDDLYAAVSRAMEGQFGSHGLASIDFSILKFCLERGECTATELAEVLPVDPSRISRLVNRLVEEGLLRRRRLREDRRVVMLSLTEPGTELVLHVGEREQALNARLTEGISEADQQGFAAAARKILANYEALRRAGQTEEGG